MVADPRVVSQLPSQLELDLLLIELEQGFRIEAKEGRPSVDPRWLIIYLLALGFTPAATQWLLREARVRACVSLI